MSEHVEHWEEDQAHDEGVAREDGTRAEARACPSEGAGEGPGPRIAGWRTWQVVSIGKEARLKSFSAEVVWEPGLNVARCLMGKSSWEINSRRHPHPCENPPGWDCQCGFWAYRSFRLLEYYQQPRHVIGVVGLGGDVVETEWGFRASHARPLAVVGDDYLARSAEDLSIPVLSVAECEMFAIEQGYVWEEA